MTSQQEEKILKQAIQKLSTLSQSEYKENLNTLMKGQGENKNKEILRYNRLLGVMLKEPFAHSFKQAEPSERSGAYFSWVWQPEKLIDENSKKVWQYDAINYIYSNRISKTRPTESELLKFLKDDVSTENGLSTYLLASIRKHLCGNKNASREITQAIEEIRRQGISIVDPNVRNLISLSSMGVVTMMIKYIPNGEMLGPLAGGITLLILNIGLDTFCNWVSAKVHELKEIEGKEQKT